MKYRFKSFVTALLTIVGVVTGLAVLSTATLAVSGCDVAPGVTAAGIGRVRPGMSAVQVVGLLGRPYAIDSYKGSGMHKIGCPDPAAGQRRVEVTDSLNLAAWLGRAAADSAVHRCDVGDFRAHDRNTTFIYSRPVVRVGRYPMLWVHFDSTARVSGVFAKQYTPYFFVEDDAMIYARSPAARSGFSIGPGALAAIFD